MKNDLNNCKVGDWIWTIKDGWVQIVDNNYCDDYRIRTINSRGYTISGKRSSADKYPSAFLEPPEGFDAEPKPCDFKKGDRVLVRKIISIISTVRYGVVTLCDDGSVWIMPGDKQWQQLPAIPKKTNHNI